MLTIKRHEEVMKPWTWKQGHSRDQQIFDASRNSGVSAGVPRVSEGLSRRGSDARHLSSSAIVGVNAGPELRSLTAVCRAAYSSRGADRARTFDSAGDSFCCVQPRSPRPELICMCETLPRRLATRIICQRAGPARRSTTGFHT